MPKNIRKLIELEEELLRDKLVDFSSEITKQQREKCTGSHTYDIENIDFDKCRLIPYVMEHLLNCKTEWLPMEKVHWWTDFSYQKIFCSIAHQKFGFRLYVTNELTKERADEFAKLMLFNLNNAIGDLKKVTSLYAKDAINSGSIILHNKFKDLEDRYVFYRDASYRKIPKSNLTIEKIRNSGSTDTALALLRFERRKNNAKAYNQETAIIYFISLIEHVCLLLYAFHNDGSKVTDLANKSWGEKFELVIGLENKEIKNGYKYLRDVALYRRNPTTHGYLTRKMTEASFYFKPARQRTYINLFNGEVIENSHGEIDLKRLDKLLSDIKNDKRLRNSMKYIAYEEFDMSFDNESLSRYQELNKLSSSEIDEFIQLEATRYDNARNMDW